MECVPNFKIIRKCWDRAREVIPNFLFQTEGRKIFSKRLIIFFFILLTGNSSLANNQNFKEGNMLNPSSQPLVFKRVIEIHASPQNVWRAITTPKIVNQYYICPLKDIELKLGGKIVYASDNQIFIRGEILEIKEGEKLVHSFIFSPETHENVEDDKPSRVTYQIKSKGENTELTLIHDGFESENQTYANVIGGWDIILKRIENSFRKE